MRALRGRFPPHLFSEGSFFARNLDNTLIMRYDLSMTVEDVCTLVLFCLVVGVVAGVIDALFGPGPFDKDELGRWRR